MAVKRISPDEASALLAEGWTYLDVRSAPEFEAGHPQGAYNVPLLHQGPAGMAPNAAFLAAVERTFAKDARLVLGCKSGGRSQQAARVLESAGYTALADQAGGFDGAPGPAGLPGWRARGLPVAQHAETGRSWRELEPKP
jgi:rhodanese-related sulfurtransferase